MCAVLHNSSKIHTDQKPPPLSPNEGAAYNWTWYMQQQQQQCFANRQPDSIVITSHLFWTTNTMKINWNVYKVNKILHRCSYSIQNINKDIFFRKKVYREKNFNPWNESKFNPWNKIYLMQQKLTVRHLFFCFYFLLICFCC